MSRLRQILLNKIAQQQTGFSPTPAIAAQRGEAINRLEYWLKLLDSDLEIASQHAIQADAECKCLSCVIFQAEGFKGCPKCGKNLRKDIK